MKSGRVYAHRGAKSEFLENTRLAFDRAIELGVDGIETDIQLSKDGVSVLWHDEHLGKLAQPEIRIGDRHYTDLRKIDLSLSTDPVGQGRGLVSLDDFVSGYGLSCDLLLEVKNLAWDRDTGRHRTNMSRCLAAAKKSAANPAGREALVSSFDFASLQYAHRQEPAQSLVLNLEPGFTLEEIQRSLDEQPWLHGYCFPIDDLDSRVAQMTSANGKCLIVYTCNSDEQIRKAFGLGVDILISDDPGKALALRN